MLKELLLSLIKDRRIRSVMEKEAFFHKFIAGHGLDDAASEVKRLNKEGFSATLNALGESVRNKKDAEKFVNNYLKILDKIEKQNLDANISVKLTAIGLLVSDRCCRKNIGKILQRAEKTRNFVWIDMEEARYAEKILKIFFFAKKKHKNVGVCLQSYLYRTSRDVKLVAGPVRIVKGVYAEPENVAFHDKSVVRQRFLNFSRYLMRNAKFTAIATHDKELIGAVKNYAKEKGIRKNRFEFQMLYGMNTRLQKQLLREGYAVRIYAPYGIKWIRYYARRVGEKLTI